MAKISPRGKFRQFSNAGDTLPGGKLYAYEAGTSTPKDTYTTAAGDVANTNPVVLDANGYADVWLESGGYKLVLKDSLDNTLWTVDDIVGEGAEGYLSSIISTNTSIGITTVHKNNLILVTASATLSLLASATAGEGFLFTVRNDHSSAITIDPDGAETIDGAGTLSIPAGEYANIVCDGTNWESFGVQVAPSVIGSLVFLSETVISNDATIDISSGFDSTYDVYVLKLTNIINATNLADTLLQVSTDGGSTFKAGASDYTYHRTNIHSGASTYFGVASNGDTSIPIAGSSGNTTTDSLDLEIRIHNPASSTSHLNIDWNGTNAIVSPSTRLFLGGGRYAAITAVDAIRIMASTGNLTSGTIRLYGISKS